MSPPFPAPGALGQLHGVDMKLFGTIPEAHTRLAPLTIYPQAAREIYFYMWGCRPPVEDEEIWTCWLDMPKLRKLRPGWAFSHVATDATTVWVYFKKSVPSSPYMPPAVYRTRPVDLAQPGLYHESNTFSATQLVNASLVAVDPGERITL